MNGIKIPKSRNGRIRLCFWMYLFFLIFEGAFRKWFIPAASNLFLIIRDPIALYVVIIGIKKIIMKDVFLLLIIGVTIISFFTTLIFGHQNLLIALYGFRITGIHIPAMFVFGYNLTREDLLKIGKNVLYCMLLMTVIIALQYFSPQGSKINVGVGGEGSSGFSGVQDYFRPSGTFSFIAGMVGFEFLAGSYLFYFLLANNNLPKRFKIPNTHLIIFSIVFISSVFLCLSRSVIFQTLILIFFIIVSLFIIQSKTNYKKISSILFLLLATFLMLLNFTFFNTAITNIMTRFTQASEAEGNVVSGTIGNRYFGSFIRALTIPQNFSGKEIPFWGFGLGMGTNVATQIMGKHDFLLAEEEWSRIVDEMGFFLGVLILIGFRIIWPLKIAIQALKSSKINKDYLTYLFIPFFVIFTIDRQWAMPTLLGFCVVVGSIQIAALKTSKNLKLISNYE